MQMAADQGTSRVANPTASLTSPGHRTRLRRLAHFLDTAIPLPGGLRIGFDGIIGLIPGAGDLIGTLMSSYIVAQAHRLGASKAVLLHMAGNIALETVVGVVPVLGDLFDFGWKANRRNVDLLAHYLDSPRETPRHSALLMAGLIGGLVLLTVAVTVGNVALVRWIWISLGG